MKLCVSGSWEAIILNLACDLPDYFLLSLLWLSLKVVELHFGLWLEVIVLELLNFCSPPLHFGDAISLLWLVCCISVTGSFTSVAFLLILVCCFVVEDTFVFGLWLPLEFLGIVFVIHHFVLNRAWRLVVKEGVERPNSPVQSSLCNNQYLGMVQCIMVDKENNPHELERKVDSKGIGILYHKVVHRGEEKDNKGKRTCHHDVTNRSEKDNHITKV